MTPQDDPNDEGWEMRESLIGDVDLTEWAAAMIRDGFIPALMPPAVQ